jgi:hypothetical protein
MRAAALGLDGDPDVVIAVGRRQYRARPVSVPAMLRVQRLSASPQVTDQLAGVLVLLAAAFPERPRWRRWRDPVRTILALEAPIQRRVVSALTVAPHPARPAEAAADRYADVRAWQRQAVQGGSDAERRGVSLELAARTCRAVFGEAWYYNPARWSTADGYVPHAVCWADYWGLDALDARQELSHLRAEAVLRASRPDVTRRQYDAIERRSYPRPLVS